jgi:hypothetical protein
MEEKLNTIFDFINDSQKLNLLVTANEMLHINKSQHNTIIFVYSAPKVGSTTIVTSLRLFCSDSFDIIHIHDEEMLRVVGKIKDININEIILYNKYLGKNVYVIDVYRSPIERKISAYFEKIGSYHFNDFDEKVNKYAVSKVIKRFNNIFPHIGSGDHFIDRYNISIPEYFDYDKKYLLIEYNGIKYIKLRLKDSKLWGDILTNIFQKKICTIHDYDSSQKTIKDIYNLFKMTYKIPSNFLDEISNCKYFIYYYSEIERKEYLDSWMKKSTDIFIPYTIEQYNLYHEITMENTHIDYIQTDHYMDEGCICKACCIKRNNIKRDILSGKSIKERVIHVDAKNELIQRRVNKVNKVNIFLKNINEKGITNKFINDMKSIVSNSK